MATWVRSLTGTAPSATNADLAGDAALDNETAPGGFDPAAINSVRIEMTIAVTGGSFAGSENHLVHNHARLVTTTVDFEADPNEADDNLDTGTSSVSMDATDSTVTQAASVADWEAAFLRPGHTPGPVWTDFNQDMGPDGVTVAVTVAIVTIDYTPSGGDPIDLTLLSSTAFYSPTVAASDFQLNTLSSAVLYSPQLDGTIDLSLLSSTTFYALQLDGNIDLTILSSTVFYSLQLDGEVLLSLLSSTTFYSISMVGVIDLDQGHISAA